MENMNKAPVLLKASVHDYGPYSHLFCSSVIRSNSGVPSVSVKSCHEPRLRNQSAEEVVIRAPAPPRSVQI